MKGKIAPILFGSLALVGLLLAVVGFGMGGRPGAVTVRNGQFVFQSGGDNITMGNAPAWFGRNWSFGVGINTHGSASLPDQAPGGGAQATLPFDDATQLRGVEVDIKGAHVYIAVGNEPGLTVEGPLPYKTELNEGIWEIKSTHNYHNLNFGPEKDGVRTILHNGEDITTIFTLVLPANLVSVDLELAVGDLLATGMEADTAEFHIDAGSIEIRGGKVRHASFDVDAGAIVAQDFYSELCEMDVDAGSIEYEGDIAQRLEASCDAGSIAVEVKAPDVFGWDTSVGAASIVIDGESYGSLFQPDSQGNEHATPFYELDCNAGSIEIVFRR